MTQPVGFVNKSYANHVCLLHKSLYGLKQAPRAWYDRFASYLLTLDFLMSSSDSSLFVHFVGSSLTYLLYVDDIVITGPDSTYVNHLKHVLSSKLQISDLDNLRYFMGLKIQPISGGIFVNQAKYLLNLLTTFGMFASKPCLTPKVST